MRREHPESNQEIRRNDASRGSGGLGPERLPPERYWSERLEQDFSLGGVGYRGLGRPFNEWAYRVRRSAVIKALTAHGLHPEGGEILEVGFGTGFFVDFWARCGARSITGLDITRRAVDEMGLRFPQHRFARQDIAAPDCPLFGAFDIVTVFDVLFHIIEEASFRRAIANTCRQIKRGGHLLLTDILSDARTVEGQTQLSRPLPDYTTALEANGVRVIGIHPIFFAMSQAPDLRRNWSRRISRDYWRVMTTLLGAAPVWGHLIGPLGYLLDSSLQRVLSRGPSVKLLVGRAEG